MAQDKNIIILQRLEGNEATHLKGIQVPLAPYTDFLIMLWWFVWIAVLIIVMYKAISEGKK
ncbi:MAG: hypothetical protein JKX80_02240 [Candidatus Pacebacteria bacterium]|nr:hypothetical protein [Candidatus Paceibacterota bacterium]